ncbi:hypothetical protein J1N35_001516 [Gossypium stocksii]|uniref:Uncharacterized protein n=1 Tax=Gossypium stocksii TaxID=47602 RepID=A0A9D3WKJ3_9ROSI|nr:hypothetical protein J1N35_001516 [Gossypium stocksii]
MKGHCCECKLVLAVCRVLYCFIKLPAKGIVLSDWFYRFLVLFGMDDTLRGLFLHEKENVELVLDGIFRVEDEINYDLCPIGLAKSLGNTMGMFLDYDASGCQII